MEDTKILQNSNTLKFLNSMQNDFKKFTILNIKFLSEGLEKYNNPNFSCF